MAPMENNEASEADIKLLSYRLDDLQRSLTTLNTAVASLSTQVMTLQLSLPDRYLTRQEFAEIVRQQDIQRGLVLAPLEDRLKKTEIRGDNQDKAISDIQRRWDNRVIGFAVAVIVLLINLILAGANIISTTLHAAPAAPGH